MLENIDMELTKENIRKIILIIFACILFSWALNNIAAFGVVLSGAWKLLAPFIIGGMIAFVMNIPMVKIEKLFMGKKKTRAKWTEQPAPVAYSAFDRCPSAATSTVARKASTASTPAGSVSSGAAMRTAKMPQLSIKNVAMTAAIASLML